MFFLVIKERQQVLDRLKEEAERKANANASNIRRNDGGNTNNRMTSVPSLNNAFNGQPTTQDHLILEGAGDKSVDPKDASVRQFKESLRLYLDVSFVSPLYLPLSLSSSLLTHPLHLFLFSSPVSFLSLSF